MKRVMLLTFLGKCRYRLRIGVTQWIKRIYCRVLAVAGNGSERDVMLLVMIRHLIATSNVT